MKTRHLVLTVAAVTLLAACSQSGFRNIDTQLESFNEYGVVYEVSEVEQNAAAGDPAAQRLLGSMYYWGENIEQSETKAIAWWSRAADKGDAIAQLNLAKVSAGEPAQGEMHASIGRELWADLEKEPTIVVKVFNSVGNTLQSISDAITGESSD